MIPIADGDEATKKAATPLTTNATLIQPKTLVINLCCSAMAPVVNAVSIIMILAGIFVQVNSLDCFFQHLLILLEKVCLKPHRLFWKVEFLKHPSHLGHLFLNR